MDNKQRLAAVSQLSADETLVLSNLAKDLSVEQVAAEMNLSRGRVEEIETAVHVKLHLYGIPKRDIRRKRAIEAYRDYGELHGHHSLASARQSEKKSDNVQVSSSHVTSAAVAEVAQRINALPEGLYKVATLIGRRLNNAAISQEMKVDLNEAGLFVSRVYASLGLPRSLKKNRRAAIWAAFSQLDPDISASTVTAVASTSTKEETMGMNAGAPSSHDESAQDLGTAAKPATATEVATRVLAEALVKLPENKRRVIRAIATHGFDEEKSLAVANDLNVSVTTLTNYLSGIHSVLGFPRKMEQTRRMELLALAWPLCGDKLAATNAKEAGSTAPEITREEIERVANAIRTMLSDRQRDIVRESSKAGWGHQDSAAKELGIAPMSLPNAMGRIYDRLQLPTSMGLKNRMRLLTLGFGRYQGMLASGGVVDEVSDSVGAADAVQTISRDSRQENVIEEESLTPRPVGNETSNGPEVHFGPPVTIRLHAHKNILGLHVVTKFANGHDEPDLFDEEIERMSKREMYPEFVTTIPTVDGKSKLIQLHFVRRSE